ncbi:MAG: secretin N-terminal domain-containing protein [Planctomycetota bacterium]
MLNFSTKQLLSAAAVKASLTAGLVVAPVFHASAQSVPPAVENPVIEEVSLLDQDGEAPRETIEVGAMGQISIEAADVDIQTVLRGLAMQAGRNIIISRNVSGSVTFTIKDAEFYAALEAILDANGFKYAEKGSFIHVMTEDEYTKLMEATKQLSTKVIRLNYLTAKDASTFLTPMLSEKGKIVASGEVTAGLDPSSDAGEDSFANAGTLVVHDFPDHIEQIEATLKQLDVQPKMVLIEATILQATLTENNALGVDFAVFADIDGLSLANPLSVVDQLITGGLATESSQGVQSTVGNTANGQGGVKVGVVGSDAAVFIRALNSVTNATIVSNPKLTILNRQRGDILVGEQLGYLSTTVTDTSTTQTVEFLDVGTQLLVRPFISDDGNIRLELKPSVSTGETNTVGGFVIPDTTVAELTTNIILRNGQTVVLGGLFTEDSSVGRNQVPGLGDIPLIGNAFRGQDDTIRRSEVIFMVKATIIEPAQATAMGEATGDYIDGIGHNMRKKFLPWSRDRLAQAHVRDALKHLDKLESTTDPEMQTKLKAKAAYAADQALYLTPTNGRAMEIKQSVTGGKMLAQDASILRTVIDDVLKAEMKDMGVAPVAAPESVSGAKPEAAVESEFNPDELLPESSTSEAAEPATPAEPADAEVVDAEPMLDTEAQGLADAEPQPETSPEAQAALDEATRELEALLTEPTAEPDAEPVADAEAQIIEEPLADTDAEMSEEPVLATEAEAEAELDTQTEPVLDDAEPAESAAPATQPDAELSPTADAEPAAEIDAETEPVLDETESSTPAEGGEPTADAASDQDIEAAIAAALADLDTVQAETFGDLPQAEAQPEPAAESATEPVIAASPEVDLTETGWFLFDTQAFLEQAQAAALKAAEAAQEAADSVDATEDFDFPAEGLTNVETD